MISKNYTIFSPHGIHARPATILLKVTKTFKSSFSLKKEEKLIPLKSMLNILALGAKCGDVISVIIEGEDEKDAALAVDSFFNDLLKNL